LERRTSAVFIIYRHRLFHDILLGVLRPESVVGAAAVHEVPMGRLLQDLRRARPDIVIVEQEANDNAAARVLATAWMLQRVVVLDLTEGIAREYRVRTLGVRDLDELMRELGLPGPSPGSPSPPAP
jgi:hypothetical protein